MDYLQRFGMKTDPFLKGKSAYEIINTPELEQALVRLNLLSQMKGIGLLAGGPGTGKTTALRKWSSSLPASRYKIFYTNLSTFSSNDFFRHLSELMGCRPAYRKSDNFKNIRREIERLSIEKGMIPVFILDEANNFSGSILEDLTVLFSFDMDSIERSIILLCGLPNLYSVLNLNDHLPLQQRIVMNFHMESLGTESIREYIRKKEKSAGASEEIFTESGIRAICEASLGVAREIDRICGRSLLVGNNMECTRIDENIVRMACEDRKMR